MPRSRSHVPHRSSGAQRSPRWAGLLLLLFFGVFVISRLPSAPSSPPQRAAQTEAPARAAPASFQGKASAPAAASDAPGEPITVAGWNIGLDESDLHTIAARIASFDGVGLWGIAEINRPSAVAELETAAEEGEAGDFRAILGPSGGGMRLAALYDDTRFDLLEWYELEEINTTGNARAPLVLHLQDTTSGEQFLFMVNHLYRSRDEERYRQAQMLNDWAEGKALPVIAVGDYNFDWEVQGGEGAHDPGYDLMTEGGAWEWVRPAELVTTQCSGWPCRYDSVLDFVFTAGPAREWPAESEIAVEPGDFPDDATTSDHRPVLATFWPGADTGGLLLPTPTPVPLPTTVPMPAPLAPIANDGANLRGGPGTDYSIVGGAAAGQALDVVGRSAGADWLLLADGSWIAAFLVDGAPAGLPVAEAPALPTPAPTAIPEVVRPAATVAVRAAPAVRASDCDPSYPGVCIPSPPPDLDCGDIGYRRFQVVGSDPHRFDGDHDGVGCESR